jgi:hypothetical protein
VLLELLLVALNKKILSSKDMSDITKKISYVAQRDKKKLEPRELVEFEVGWEVDQWKIVADYNVLLMKMSPQTEDTLFVLVHSFLKYYFITTSVPTPNQKNEIYCNTWAPQIQANHVDSTLVGDFMTVFSPRRELL